MRDKRQAGQGGEVVLGAACWLSTHFACAGPALLPAVASACCATNIYLVSALSNGPLATDTLS